MNKKQIPLLGMLTALTVALSMAFIIPVPATKGFVTLCEVGIYTSALLFGPAGGLWVGALSGGLIDLLSGYPEWAIFSIIIHGTQGYLAGWISQRFPKQGKYLGLAVGSIVMIVGYAFATAFLYTWPAGLISIPSNLVQNGFGIVVTLLLTTALKRTLPHVQHK